ncbi:MAG: hypothetical protein D6785_01720, partial [Planctomycetota bacterium]
RYYVQTIWLNATAGAKLLERKIPLRDFLAKYQEIQKLLANKYKVKKLYFILKANVVKDRVVPLMGWDPNPPRRKTYLVVPVFTRKEIARYYWSRLGKKAYDLQVKEISFSDFLDELYKMRGFWRGKGKKRLYLSGVWFNPRFEEVEVRIPLWVLLKIRAVLRGEHPIISEKKNGK